MRIATRAALAATGVGLALAAVAFAAGALTKINSGSLIVPAGQTRTMTVPYPDALEYGNARYSGSWRLLLSRSHGGRAASIAKVTVLRTGSVQGGSAYAVRVHNANASGTTAVRLEVTATTVEPLPHH
jgi:hypothetical protein